MTRLPDARPPEGMRIYAIGDVHGCVAELRAMHALIGADLEARPVGDWRIVHVGDYVDRGADSAGTLAYLAGLADDPRMICLRGNHDQYLIDFLEDPETPALASWLLNGGETTLRDFGLSADAALTDAGARRALHAALLSAMPARSRAFVGSLALHARFGDYLFVHAGLRPGIPLERQSPRDLMWIRGEFRDSDADHGAVVVHGHTPVRAVEVRSNRIGIDTGLVYGGTLSCLVLEGDERGLLRVEGIERLMFPGDRRFTP